MKRVIYYSSLRRRARRMALIIAATAPFALCAAPIIDWSLVDVRPHDPANWTQGLVFSADGRLFESSGLYRESRLQELETDSLQPLRTKYLAPNLFAEGIALHDGELFLLTWREQTLLVLDPDTFAVNRTLHYEGEGWGLTSDGDRLWMSNGSSDLLAIDSVDARILERLAVTLDGEPLDRLNELEWIDGQIYANRWFDDRIYRIDPHSGAVDGILDLTELAAPHAGQDYQHILNGIARHPVSGQLWITGKFWNALYLIQTDPDTTSE